METETFKASAKMDSSIPSTALHVSSPLNSCLGKKRSTTPPPTDRREKYAKTSEDDNPPEQSTSDRLYSDNSRFDGSLEISDSRVVRSLKLVGNNFLPKSPAQRSLSKALYDKGLEYDEITDKVFGPSLLGVLPKTQADIVKARIFADEKYAATKSLIMRLSYTIDIDINAVLDPKAEQRLLRNQISHRSHMHAAVQAQVEAELQLDLCWARAREEKRAAGITTEQIEADLEAQAYEARGQIIAKNAARLSVPTKASASADRDHEDSRQGTYVPSARM